MSDEPVNERATMRTVDGQPELRFERRLRHPPAKVWRAISDPAELAHWFPAVVEAELRPGAPMRFTFPEQAPVDGSWDGEVLEVDPPRVYMFRWNQDVLRFELLPDGDGCLLVFTQTIGGGWVGRLSAGRSAAGWDACLDNLAARLAGDAATPFDDWLDSIERYVEEFGLGEGTVRPVEHGFELHFARDLVWKPVAQAWAVLVEDSPLDAEPPVRAGNHHIPAGKLTAVEAPHLLEYEWCGNGEPVGRVRWAFVSDPALGVRVELTQSIPESHAALLPIALAAWQVHLELFFAAVHGDVRCPWPTDRVEELAKRHASRR